MAQLKRLPNTPVSSDSAGGDAEELPATNPSQREGVAGAETGYHRPHSE